MGGRLAQEMGARRSGVVRYADDIILGFQHQAEADRFWKTFGNDLVGLDWNYTQTRRAGLSSGDCRTKPKRRGEGKPETFDFLGFKHISGKNRLGRFTVRRKTIRNAWE